MATKKATNDIKITQTQFEDEEGYTVVVQKEWAGVSVTKADKTIGGFTRADLVKLVLAADTLTNEEDE